MILNPNNSKQFEVFNSEQDFFEKAGYDVDIFLEQHSESRELTQDEVKNIKALCDIAIKFNFGDKVLLGTGRSCCSSCIFKINESTWILWETDERRGFYNSQKFDNVTFACIEIIKRTIKSESMALGIQDFNFLLKQEVSESSLIKFATSRDYVYPSIAITKDNGLKRERKKLLKG